jgi:hypothetical protein
MSLLNAMTKVKDSGQPTIGLVKILPSGSTNMYVSIDEYTDHALWNNRNSLDSINLVMSDDTSDNPVIELLMIHNTYLQRQNYY